MKVVTQELGIYPFEMFDTAGCGVLDVLVDHAGEVKAVFRHYAWGADDAVGESVVGHSGSILQMGHQYIVSITCNETVLYG